MTTGLAWNVDNPAKPYAQFDADAVRDIPVEWDLWFADVADPYASHVVLTDPNLQCVQSSQALGVIKVRIKKAAAGVLVEKTKYWFTVRVTTATGQVQDTTLWLKIRPF